MNIRFEQLIYTVQECFDDIAGYEKSIRSSEWKEMSADQHRYYERNEYHATNQIWNLCSIFNIDTHRLYTVVRMIRHWEEARNWERCFPYSEELNQRILEYMSK